VIKLFGSSSQNPATPVPNSYWVEPGRLLAGEYPGAARGEAQDRIQALLQAGITSFIDLTAEGELPAYHAGLARDVSYRRFPITDHGVPDSSAVMADIVAAIAQDLADGRRVYVHCRAGIGRTGMAVGCYLIHQGLDGTAALDKLQDLWRRCSRARSWPSVPETDEQVRFVRTWIAPGARAGSAQQRAEGAVFGLAMGEGLALAAREQGFSEARFRVESKRIERLPSGADTAMTLAVAESLVERGGHDSYDQLQRYVAWTQQFAAQARVPPELKRVLAVWQWSRKPNPGSHDPKNLDPHPLARTLAAVLWTKGDVERAAELAAEIARTTLQSPLVLDAVRLWAATLAAAFKGDAKDDLLSLKAAQAVLRQRQLKPQIAALLGGDWRRTEPLDGALSVVANTLDIFRATSSFEAAICEAVRGGSTCGALVGSLAGAYYGSQALPVEWRRAVPDAARLGTAASRFAG